MQEKKPAFYFTAAIFETPRHAIGHIVRGPEEFAKKKLYLKTQRYDLKETKKSDTSVAPVHVPVPTQLPAPSQLPIQACEPMAGIGQIYYAPPVDSYSLDTLGRLVYYDKNAKEEIVSNYIPRLVTVQCLLDENGEEKGRRYEVEVEINGRIIGNVLVPDLIDAAKVIEQKYPVTTHGAGCSASNKKIKNFLKQDLSSAAFLCVLTEPGWCKVNGEHRFAVDGRNLSRNGLVVDTGYRIEYSSEFAGSNIFRTCELLRNISSDSRVGAICLLYSLHGVLFRLFKEAGFPIQYLLFITGTTGSLKTSLSKVFFTHFNTDKPIQLRTFRDTKASFEHGLRNAKDTLCIFDDFYPGTTAQEQNELREKLETIIRFVGDSIGKNRSNVKLEDVQGNSARGAVVITGENKISGQSANLRCLNLSIEKGTVDKDILAFFQGQTAAIPTFVFEFAEFLESRYEYTIDTIRREFPLKRKNYSVNIKEGRLVDCAATFDIVAEILGVFLNKCCGIAEEICIPWIHNIVDDVLAVMWQNEDEAQSNDTAICYGEAISRLISTGEIRLGSRQEYFAHVSKFEGFMENGYYFINADVAYEKFRLLQSKSGVEAIPQKSVCQRQLEELGLLEKQSNGKNETNTVKLGPSGMRQRFLKINKANFEKLF